MEAFKFGKGDWKTIILDEIALEGLEGVSLEGLWKLLEKALNLSSPPHQKLKQLIWNYLKEEEESNLLEFFILPEPKEPYKIVDRNDFVDKETGFPILPDECPFYRPAYKCVIEPKVRGSCANFYERRKLTNIESKSLDEIQALYGEKLVVVANQEYREGVLFPESTQQANLDLTNVQYCALEAIGRSRYNGEVTVGKHLISGYIKDYIDVFYVKMKFSLHKLIVKQNYLERLQGRVTTGHLLTLPRFYQLYKTRPVLIIEKLHHIVSTAPNNRIDVVKLKQISPFEGLPLKQLSKISIYTKYFEVVRFPYKEFYPGDEKTTKKIVTAICFRKPNLTLEEIFDSLNPGTPENETIEFLSDENYYLDMPLQEQIFRFIKKCGSTGCSQMQIIRYTASNRYTIRQVIRNFLRMGYITEYSKDAGRQRVLMYVTADQKNNIKNSKAEIKQKITESAQVNEEELMKIMNEGIDMEEEFNRETQHTNHLKKFKATNVLAIVKETNTPYANLDKILKCDPKTERHQKRIECILETIKEKFLVEKYSLKKKIVIQEAELGYKDQICSKSFYRLIKWLIDQKMIKFFELTLKYNKYVKILYYVSHFKLEATYKIFRNEVFKQKISFIARLEERDLRRMDSSSKQTVEKPTKKNEINHREMFLKAPKFIIARFMHEFLYYVIYELDFDTKPIVDYENIKNQLIDIAPKYDLENNLPSCIYQDSINWRMFIAPLPDYSNKPFGWAYVMDLYARLPLSIAMKMFHISKYPHPLLKEYVEDPIKQHLLISHLPDELRDILADYFHLIRSFMNALKFLNWMGLLQPGQRNLKDLRECWIYLNLNAKILDTRTSETGYCLISKHIQYAEILFKFVSFQEVQDYWENMYRISCSTKLNARVAINRPRAQKIPPLEFFPGVEFDEALKRDVGYIPGDNLGAAGLNSTLYAHLQRNWSLSVGQATKKLKKKPKPVSKYRFTSQIAKTAFEKPIKVKTFERMKVKSIKRIPVKRKCTVKKEQPKTKTPVTKNEYDEVDKGALRNMLCLRVSWSKNEDRMLKICRAVFIYLSSSISGLHRAINSYLYRDILHWSLNSLDKTSKACQRRLRFLMSHYPSADVMNWVNEIRQNSFINEHFNVNYLMNIRNEYKKDADFMIALKILFIHMVNFLNIYLDGDNDIIKKSRTSLPDTLNEVYLNYTEMDQINTQTDIANIRDFCLKHYDPVNFEEIDIYTINSVMHSTLCCTRDKTLYHIQIFEVYKKYSEEILAKAYKKARDDNLIVQLKFKHGSEGSKLVPIAGSSIVLSVKYKQQLFTDIPYNVIGQCFRQFENCLNYYFGESKSPWVLKTVDSGGFFYLLEQIATDQIDLNIKLPAKILTLDPHHNSYGYEDDTGRIMDHFHYILESAPKNEYVKYFEDDNQNSSSHIKFNKINETFKLNYNPYETLLKLSDDYYHFYCTLDNLNKIIDLDFNRFNLDTFCPFNCILKNANPISVIDQLIKNRKSIIEEMSIGNETENIIESVMMLTKGNLMQVFERLQNTLRDRFLTSDKKDFGKINSERIKVDMLKLTKDLIDFTGNPTENHFEVESNYIREDKKLSQDGFVVNLPTLQIIYKEDIMKKARDKFCMYKSMPVPKEFVMNVIHRDEILKKVIWYAHWSHNGDEKKFFQTSSFKRLTKREQKFTENVFEYLSNFELGVTADNLVDTFKDEKLLVQACNLLRKNFLIMRVGVKTFVYVHKKHVHRWVVNSYNIKRLNKEALQDSKVIIKTVKTCEGEKRHSSNVEIDEPPTKKIINEVDGKRISKPTQQYTSQNPSSMIEKELNLSEKEHIVIRPYPWIRINGSLNRRVLDKWMGVILLDCLTNTGQTILTICERFNNLHPTNLRCLLEILQDLKCLKLRVLKRSEKKLTLFSNYEDEIVEDATEFSKMEDTFIIALPKALTNLSIFIGEKKYTMDFI